MRFVLILAATLLGACATTAPPTATTPTAITIIRATQPATTDYADGVSLTLTPSAHADFAQLRLVERPGYRTPLHVHHDTDETFLVVEGELRLFVNGALHTLGPGDYAMIPRGTPHAQGNATDADTIVLLTLAPGAFADFFNARPDLVRETPPGHPDYRANMLALGERFDIEVLAPPPF